MFLIKNLAAEFGQRVLLAPCPNLARSCRTRPPCRLDHGRYCRLHGQIRALAVVVAMVTTDPTKAMALGNAANSFLFYVFLKKFKLQKIVTKTVGFKFFILNKLNFTET